MDPTNTDRQAQLAGIILYILNFGKDSALEKLDNDLILQGQGVLEPFVYSKAAKTALDYISQAAGPTIASEAQLLAQMRHSSGALTLDRVQNSAPWNNRAPDDIFALTNGKLGGEFFNIAASNGHYFDLALHNWNHFSADGLNWSKFDDYQQKAFKSIRANGSLPAPIPAEAVALTAFGLHFLTDAFSAGHMRVPRRVLGVHGGAAAKLMHDLDGKFGLWVQDDLHPNKPWRAFGDGYLRPRTDDVNLQAGLRMLRYGDPQAEQNQAWLTNHLRVKEAAATAMIQLLYEANRLPRFARVLARAGALGNAYDLSIGPNVIFAPDELTAIRGLLTDAAVDARMRVTLGKRRPRPTPAGAGLTENHPPLLGADGMLGPNLADSYYLKHESLDMVRKLTVARNGESVDVDFSDQFHAALHTHFTGGWLDGGETHLIPLCDALDKLHPVSIP